MEEQTDSTFIKNISLVLGALVVFTVVIIFVARDIGFMDEEGNNPSNMAHAEERIKSVADVYTGDEVPAPAQVATADAAPAAAFDGSLDGEMIYNTVCMVCHATAVLGAPKPGSPEMAQRLEKGFDAVLQTALSGLNAMPPRGGRADLSDEQMKVAIEFMTK